MIYLVNEFTKVEGQEYNTWRYYTAGDVIKQWCAQPWTDCLDDSMESRFVRAALLDNQMPSQNPLHPTAEIRAIRGEAPKELHPADPQNGVVDLVCIIGTDSDNCITYTLLMRKK